MPLMFADSRLSAWLRSASACVVHIVYTMRRIVYSVYYPLYCFHLELSFRNCFNLSNLIFFLSLLSKFNLPIASCLYNCPAFTFDDFICKCAKIFHICYCIFLVRHCSPFNFLKMSQIHSEFQIKFKQFHRMHHPVRNSDDTLTLFTDISPRRAASTHAAIRTATTISVSSAFAPNSPPANPIKSSRPTRRSSPHHRSPASRSCRRSS